MTRSRTFFALLLTATVFAYAGAHRSNAAATSPASTAPVRVPVAEDWIPPSFDIETAPLEDSAPADPRTSAAFEQ